MLNPKPLSVLVFVSLATIACQGRTAEDPVRALMGKPYTGFVKVRVAPPNAKSWTQFGEGSAHFIDQSGGRARLVVFGAIDNKKGDAGFTLDGSYDRTGWRSDSGGVRLTVGPDGRISGGGTIPPQIFKFSGTASESAIALTVDIELMQGTKANMPKGTNFRFDYDLSRAAPGNDAAKSVAAKSGGSKSGKKCKKIRYEMRPVANIGDGSMSMMQVPVCITK